MPPPHVLLLLLRYFDDAAIAGTLANIPRSFADAHLVAQGWVPIDALARFRRMRELAGDASDIRAALALLPALPQLFELSPDSAYLRRSAQSLNAASLSKELSALSVLAGHAVEALGFDDGTSAAEVQQHFSQFGPVVHVTVAHGTSWDPEFNTSYLIEFASIDSMIRALVANNHKYEDTHIQVRARRKQGIEPLETQTTSEDVHPTRKSAVSLSKQYPKDRIVEFRFESDPGTVTTAAIQTEFERFAPVKTVEYQSRSLIGRVQFKASVARDILGVIVHAGGVQVGDGGSVHLRAVSGDGEQLYWMVREERTKMDAASFAAANNGNSALAQAVRAARSGIKTRGRGKGRRGGLSSQRCRGQNQSQTDTIATVADKLKKSGGSISKSKIKGKPKGKSGTRFKTNKLTGQNKLGGNNACSESLESTISKLSC